MRRLTLLFFWVGALLTLTAGTALTDTTMTTGSGNDVLRGTSGPATLRAGSGNDALYGSGGADSINGESGKDKLSGGAGRDIIFGGYGGDTARRLRPRRRLRGQLQVLECLSTIPAEACGGEAEERCPLPGRGPRLRGRKWRLPTPVTSASDPSRHSSSERVIARLWAERTATVPLMFAGGRLETTAHGAGGLVSASG